MKVRSEPISGLGYHGASKLQVILVSGKSHIKNIYHHFRAKIVIVNTMMISTCTPVLFFNAIGTFEFTVLKNSLCTTQVVSKRRIALYTMPLRYEDMKDDFASVIRQVAAFLGKEVNIKINSSLF